MIEIRLDDEVIHVIDEPAYHFKRFDIGVNQGGGSEVEVVVPPVGVAVLNIRSTARHPSSLDAKHLFDAENEPEPEPEPEPVEEEEEEAEPVLDFGEDDEDE